MIKVAVVGYGLSATVFHLPFLLHSEQYQIVAVSSSQRDAVLEQYPEVEVYGDAQSMIEQCDAQLVVITAPNVVHHDLARTALEVGKHVVLEKPMTVTSEQALELSRLAEQEKLILSVYHNRRWDGDFLTIQQLINSGELGQIKVFNSNFDRFRPQIRDRWRELPGAGTGVLYDLGSHLIDQTLCLFGDPQAVTARCTALREGSESTDYFHIMLHYAFLEVVLQASPFVAGPNVRFQLQGTKGSYYKQGLDPQEQQLRDGLSLSAPAFGVEPPAHYGYKYWENRETGLMEEVKFPTQVGRYIEYYQQLALAISVGLPLPVTALSAAKVIRIIELAEQSSDSGQRVDVDLTAFH